MLTLLIAFGVGSALAALCAIYRDVRFVVPNSYQSAMASLPEAELDRLGATRAAIEIAPLASLVPEPKPGDTSPITADEIAVVTGTSRV